jgi:hypothetical protein
LPDDLTPLNSDRYSKQNVNTMHMTSSGLIEPMSENPFDL